MPIGQVKDGGIPYGPRIDANETYTTTLVAATNTPLDLATILPNVQVGNVVGFTCSVATQIAFGDSAVTIAASNPAIPAGRIDYFVPSGEFLALKSTGAAVVYMWNAGKAPL